MSTPPYGEDPQRRPGPDESPTTPQPQPGQGDPQRSDTWGTPGSGQPSYRPTGQTAYGSSAEPAYGSPAQPAYGPSGPPRPPSPGQSGYGPGPFGPQPSSGQPQYGPGPFGAQPSSAGQPGYGPGPYGPQPAYGPPGQPPPGWQSAPPSKPPRDGKRTALIAALVAVGVLIVAGVALLVYVLSATILDRSAVEQAVSAQFEERNGVSLDLECRHRMIVRPGADYECEGTTADGEEVEIRIVVTGKDGAYTWSED